MACRLTSRRSTVLRAAFVLMASFLAPLGAARAGTIDPTSFNWEEHPGAMVAPDTALRDETGQSVTLGSAFTGVPVVLDLDYYHCPSLCGVVRADLLNALATSGLKAGKDYTVVSLSIDPSETPEDAAQARRADLAQSPGMDPAAWHYFTGSAEAVSHVASEVGFRYRWDERYKQFLHPTGLVVLTGAGRISGYLLGVGYTGGDVRAAVIKARAGGIAKAALPILLLCFHFDATTGRYTLEIMKVLRLMGALTVLTIGGLMLLLHLRARRGGTSA